jgi:outer membrane receptor protein involved in Fe transport
MYYQPPFYRELRDMNGVLNTNLKAQQSYHAVIGTDWNFSAWGRPFKLVAEVYYKYLDNIVPYEIDNVRIRYYATNNARGYATGIDLKVNGEFVKGIESWASLSVMTVQEDIKDDFYYDYLEFGWQGDQIRCDREQCGGGQHAHGTWLHSAPNRPTRELLAVLSGLCAAPADVQDAPQSGAGHRDALRPAYLRPL